LNKSHACPAAGQGQKNERQKNGVWHYAREVDDNGMEQTANIFLSSMFLSSECFFNHFAQDYFALFFMNSVNYTG
jgi:hypothetical protein